MKCLSIAGTSLTLALLLGGCLNAAGTSGPTGDNTLTATERDAVGGALDGVETLGMATNVAQSVTAAEDNQTGLDLPDGGPLTFGTCPIVTIAESALSDGFTVTVNYGDGCEPALLSPLRVSGSATGSFGQSADSFSLTFSSLTIGDDSLAGGVELTFQRAGQVVTLTGQWDIAVGDAEGQVSASGSGSVSFDLAGGTTTITGFTGSVTNQDGTFAVVMTGVQIAGGQGGTPIPVAGTITVTTADARTLTITFDENAPATGEIQVSADEGPALTLDIHEL